jgi:hypothetical protein
MPISCGTAALEATLWAVMPKPMNAWPPEVLGGRHVREAETAELARVMALIDAAPDPSVDPASFASDRPAAILECIRLADHFVRSDESA